MTWLGFLSCVSLLVLILFSVIRHVNEDRLHARIGSPPPVSRSSIPPLNRTVKAGRIRAAPLTRKKLTWVLITGILGGTLQRAPSFDKAFFRKATCTPVDSHFQKLRLAQVLFFCTGTVFLYCFSGSCKIFTDSCNWRNIDLSRLAYTKNTCML